QERAKPAFLLIRSAQRVLLEHVSEKSLDEILCFRRSVTAMTQKSVKRRPVRFTEIRQCFLRGCVRLGFPSAHHERPMRRVEWRSSFLQCSRYRFHGLRFLSLAAAFAYRMPAKFRNADLRGKKIVELDLRRAQTRQK